MPLFFNTETKEFPLYIMDIKNEYPECQDENSLPEHIVEFEYAEYPVEIPENHIVDPIKPIFTDGKWVSNWNIYPANEEQILNLARQKQEYEEKMFVLANQEISEGTEEIVE